jgi:hypothetical protein
MKAGTHKRIRIALLFEMTATRLVCSTIAALLGFTAVAFGTTDAPVSTRATPGNVRVDTRLRCTLAPSKARLLFRVERDTVLASGVRRGERAPFGSVTPGYEDSLLATADTPMPAGRIRLTRMDSATRAALRNAGIRDSQPLAFIKAVPYRGDCRMIRYTDSMPWVRSGDAGFARASLQPRERWVNGVPLFLIGETWFYPYPRRRGLASGVSQTTPLASPDVMYDLFAALDRPYRTFDFFVEPDTADRAPAAAWARANPASAEVEPIRTMLRRILLRSSGAGASPSRLRGTYRLTMESRGVRDTWYFRTSDRAAFAWSDIDTGRTTADILRSPMNSGYVLLGNGARKRDALPLAPQGNFSSAPQVWLAVNDQPAQSGNEMRSVLRGQLEFRRVATSEGLWPPLDAFVAPMSAALRDYLTRTNTLPTRAQEMLRFPVTLRIEANGVVRGETTYVDNGQRLRLQLQRVDTTSVTRPR